MHKYRSPQMAGLAAQLKRGPVRLTLRQLCNVEFLLSLLEPGAEYPFEFVVHTLTGFRGRRSASSDQPDAPLLPVEVIRDDLVTLAEEISARADMSASAWPEPVYTVSELARRFDVSTKTIFRWHRRGLVGWRVRGEDRRLRLVFPERCVRRFVAENVALVSRGSSFSQLSGAEREHIIERGRQLAAAGERTVNAVARAIAAETGRAVETIRLILKHYDECHPRAGIFNRSSLAADADDERLKVWEAYQDGASLGELAQRFGRPVREVYRIITVMRACELKSRPIEYVYSGEFDAPGADERIMNDPAALAPTAEPGGRVPAELPPYLQQLFRIGLLTPAGEAALFRKFNYLKYKADRLRKALDAETATARDLDRIEALLEQAGQIKNQIIQANLRLVVSIAKRHATRSRDFFEIISDGNLSLMRAVEKFDYSRGFKFSTYASWAIAKNYARTMPEHRLQQERYQTGREELLEQLSGRPPEEHESDYLPALRASLDRMLGALDEREREILRWRFGLDEQREPQTLQQIGRRLGVSKERVRQLEARAIARLRGEFGGQVERLLSP